MSLALVVALLATGALLAISAYFFMGSLPLLVLKYDTPMDARFVRGFVGTYYRIARWTAAVAAVAYALAGQAALSAGAAALTALAVVAHRLVISRMDFHRAQMQPGAAEAIRGFRRMQLTAVVLNFAQLVLLVATLIAISIRMKH